MIQITNQKSNVDNFIALDLQKGLAGIATLELQKGSEKDDKNSERRDKE